MNERIALPPPHVQDMLRRAAGGVRTSLAAGIRAGGVTWATGHTNNEILDFVAWVEGHFGQLPSDFFGYDGPPRSPA